VRAHKRELWTVQNPAPVTTSGWILETGNAMRAGGTATLSWSAGEVAADGGAVGAGVDADEVGELVDE
jgi:hypothetical protein